MERLLFDLRYALRGFSANPALTAVMVLSLAVGIGPNSAIFSVIDGFGFRPLPIHDPASLLTIASRPDNSAHDEMSYPDYADIENRARLLESVAMEGPLPVGFSRSGGAPELVIGSTVSASYFRTLGVKPALGRTFLDEEDRVPGRHPVAIISDRLWQRVFDRDRGAIGEVVRLNRTDCTIVGVMPPGFTGTQAVLAPELWVPAMAWPLFDRGGTAATLEARGRRGLKVLARARPGVTIDQVAQELESLGARLAQEWPATNAGRRLVSAYEQAARRRLVGRIGLFALLVVSLILLIAAANVAGLLIGRSEARRQEMAIRAAVGAGRGRLVRQLLTECGVLGLAAAALGLVLAFGMLKVIQSLIPPMPIPMNFDFRVDWRVLAFTLAVATLAVPLFGLGPALVASRTDLVSRLRSDGRSGRSLLRNALVAGQIGITLVLLVGAGLILRGLVNARAVDPGFIVRPMAFGTLSPAILGYDEARTREFYRQLLERLSSSPGIERATMVRHMPLNALYGGGGAMEVSVPGREPDVGQRGVSVRYNSVSDGYFATMGTRILRGRDFDRADHRGAPGVAIVNDVLARQLWPAGDAIGRRLHLKGAVSAAAGRDVQIVGIAQNGRYFRLTETPQPYLYVPWAQHYVSEMTVLVRFSGSAQQAIAAFRRSVREVDPAMPTLRIVSLDEHLRLALVVERMTALLGGILGGLGLLLSATGLYGVIAYLVSRRTREIGIRLALGARPRRVVAQVVGHAVRPAAFGMIAGLMLAYGAARIVASELYGVRATDPLVFAAAALLVVGIAVAAAWLPARRAARLDPVSALRSDG